MSKDKFLDGLLGGFGGAIPNLGIGIVGKGLDYLFGRLEQGQSAELQEHLMRLQQQLNIEGTTQLYNELYSPAAKRKQLEDAGLSVGLMYGGSGAGGQSSTTPGVTAQAVQQLHTGGILQQARMAAEIANINADTDKKESEAGLIDANTYWQQQKNNYSDEWINAQIREFNGNASESESEALLNKQKEYAAKIANEIQEKTKGNQIEQIKYGLELLKSEKFLNDEMQNYYQEFARKVGIEADELPEYMTALKAELAARVTAQIEQGKMYQQEGNYYSQLWQNVKFDNVAKSKQNKEFFKQPQYKVITKEDGTIEYVIDPTKSGTFYVQMEQLRKLYEQIAFTTDKQEQQRLIDNATKIIGSISGMLGTAACAAVGTILGGKMKGGKVGNGYSIPTSTNSADNSNWFY